MVLKPPSSTQSFGFSPSGRTRCLLVGSNDRAIDIMNGPVQLPSGIGLLLHGLKEALPDASLAPTIEAASHGAPRAITFGQIAPWGADAQNPQDAVEDASMVRSGSTGPRLLRRKQRLEPLPLRVGEFFACHTGEGLDHGIGHPIRTFLRTKALENQRHKAFKDLCDCSGWPKVADAVIRALASVTPAGLSLQTRPSRT